MRVPCVVGVPLMIFPFTPLSTLGAAKLLHPHTPRQQRPLRECASQSQAPWLGRQTSGCGNQQIRHLRLSREQLGAEMAGSSFSYTHFSNRWRSQTVCWGSVVSAIVALASMMLPRLFALGVLPCSPWALTHSKIISGM